MQRPAPSPFLSLEKQLLPQNNHLFFLCGSWSNTTCVWVAKSSNFLGAVLAPVPASSLKSVLSVIKATSRSPVCLTLVSYFSTDSEEKRREN